ncbi:MAG: hypothetical protein ACXVEE_13310 [Polyangiales bacterium]
MSKLAPWLTMKAAAMHADATPVPSPTAPAVAAPPPPDPQRIDTPVVASAPMTFETVRTSGDDDFEALPFLPNKRRRIAIALAAVLVVVSVAFGVSFGSGSKPPDPPPVPKTAFP